MSAGTAIKNIPKEYEQDFAIRELKRDLENLTKKMDDLSSSITSLHVSIIEMGADLKGKIKDNSNENLWKTLIGTGVLLGIFKYFS